MTEADHTLKSSSAPTAASSTPASAPRCAHSLNRWRREATGGIAIELPVGASNERAAADSVRDDPFDPGRDQRAAERHRRAQLSGARTATSRPSASAIRAIAAQAGPCGLWPEDIGPSSNRDYFENQPLWNHGCATQRNLAAMVDNPADLVQPRGETPSYTMRRTTVVEKYRVGQSAGDAISRRSMQPKSVILANDAAA